MFKIYNLNKFLGQLSLSVCPVTAPQQYQSPPSTTHMLHAKSHDNSPPVVNTARTQARFEPMFSRERLPRRRHKCDHATGSPLENTSESETLYTLQRIYHALLETAQKQIEILTRKREASISNKALLILIPNLHRDGSPERFTYKWSNPSSREKSLCGRSVSDEIGCSMLEAEIKDLQMFEKTLGELNARQTCSECIQRQVKQRSSYAEQQIQETSPRCQGTDSKLHIIPHIIHSLPTLLFYLVIRFLYLFRLPILLEFIRQPSYSTFSGVLFLSVYCQTISFCNPQQRNHS